MMSIIIERKNNLNLNNFHSLSEEEVGRLTGKFTKFTEIYEVSHFKLRLNSDTPKIHFGNVYNDYEFPVVRGWDDLGMPNDYINRVWFNKVEVFNFDDFDYSARFIVEKGCYSEMMYLK